VIFRDAGPTPAGGLGRVVAEMTVSKKASTAALESFSQRLFRVTTPWPPSRCFL
jgi:hypothetical protein